MEMFPFGGIDLVGLRQGRKLPKEEAEQLVVPIVVVGNFITQTTIAS